MLKTKAEHLLEHIVRMHAAGEPLSVKDILRYPAPAVCVLYRDGLIETVPGPHGGAAVAPRPGEHTALTGASRTKSKKQPGGAGPSAPQRPPKRLWSAEENARLVGIQARKQKRKDATADLGRSTGFCAARLSYLKYLEENGLKPRHRSAGGPGRN